MSHEKLALKLAKEIQEMEDARNLATLNIIIGTTADNLLAVEPDLEVTGVDHPNWAGVDKIITMADKKSPHETQVQLMEKFDGTISFHLSTAYGSLDEQQVAEILAILRRSKR